MFVPGARGALLRSSLVTAAAALPALAAPMGAGAASNPVPPPPTSTANCYGSVTPGGATVDDPNNVGYAFHCDTRITAYTIVVNRYRHNAGTIDDFSTAPNVFQQDGVTPDPNVSWTCEGQIPSDGFNCNTGSPTGFMGAWSYAEGAFDTTDPYCGIHPASTGTSPVATSKAEATAVVQLVVSDVSGAEDGPFTLASTVACPTPKPKKHKHRHRHTHRGTH
jgi:hypothetical protein